MFMKISPDLPAAWQARLHFDWRLTWLTNQPTAEELAELEELHTKMYEVSVPEVAITDNRKGFAGIEGWYRVFDVNFIQFSDENPFVAIKKYIVNTDFHGYSPFNRLFNDDKTVFTAPVHIYKGQRKDLLEKVRLTLESDFSDGDTFQAVLQVSPTYAIAVIGQVVAYADAIKTQFSSPTNPIRSFIGQPLAVSQYTDGDEDWIEQSRGILEMTENTVTIGTWSKTFEATEMVHGRAFEEAWLEFPDELMDIGFHKPDIAPPDIGMYDDE